MVNKFDEYIPKDKQNGFDEANNHDNSFNSVLI